MKKLNQRGFTLIELIIAMSIFSVVLMIGYQVINGSTRIIYNQQNTSKNQKSLNIVNEYLSKDLEQSTRLIHPSVDILEELGENSFYEYKIETKHRSVNNYIKESSYIDKAIYEVIYRVDISKSKNKFLYTLSRKDEDSNLELIYNQEIHSTDGKIEAPFIINEDEFINGLYNVRMNYIDRTYEKQSEFDVVSRYIESNNSAIIPPGKPEIEISDEITVANQVVIHNRPGGKKYWEELDKPHYRIVFAKSMEEDRQERNEPLRLDTNIKIEYSKDLDDNYDDNFYDPYHDRVMKVELKPEGILKKHFANRNKYNTTFKYSKCKKVMLKVQTGPNNPGPNYSSEGKDKIQFLKLYGVKINGEEVGDIEVDTIFEIKNPTDEIVVEIESVKRIDNGETDKYEHDDLFIKFGN